MTHFGVIFARNHIFVSKRHYEEMATQGTRLQPIAGTAMRPASVAICELTIERFRGFETFSWKPSRGTNVLLGGGDIGKSTILDAIALLLSPTNSHAVSDTDYYMRDTTAGFSIEAVLSLPPGCGIHEQRKPSWPWEWRNGNITLPGIEGTDVTKGEPVFRLRVRGTEDLELAYEIVQPDGTTDILPVALRKSIGLVRLAGDDRNDRDLRLVYGSALDRLLSDNALRSRLTKDLAGADVASQLSSSATEALTVLEAGFRKQQLPHDLGLSISGGYGASLASLIGLTAASGGTRLPLTCWGAGTRRLAALTIAAQTRCASPIVLVDEIERGLEPYRQRVLMSRLQAEASQVFITTHSPFTIAAGSQAQLWYMDHERRIGPLDQTKIARHRTKDPVTFLSRLTIIAEGATEVGFVSELLERALDGPPVEHGVHISDGCGHENTLLLLEALGQGGLLFGAFADDEGKHQGRWAKVTKLQGALVFRWKTGCIEQNVISSVPDNKLETLLIDTTGAMTGVRLRTLADRLGAVDKTFDSLRPCAESSGLDLKAVVIEAALGTVPPGKEGEGNQYRSHAHCWFKTVSGGRELARKLFSLGLWPVFRPQLLPFCNAVRSSLKLSAKPDLVP